MWFFSTLILRIFSLLIILLTYRIRIYTDVHSNCKEDGTNYGGPKYEDKARMDSYSDPYIRIIEL